MGTAEERVVSDEEKIKAVTLALVSDFSVGQRVRVRNKAFLSNSRTGVVRAIEAGGYWYYVLLDNELDQRTFARTSLEPDL